MRLMLAATAATLLFATAAPAASTAPAAGPRVRVAEEASGLTARLTSGAQDSPTAQAEHWMRGLAPGWTPNRGQVAGANGAPAHDVLYTLSAPNVRLHVSRRGLTAFLLAREPHDGGRADEREAESGRVRWTALEVELVGADIRAERALEQSRRDDLGEQHFYAPHCPQGVIGVPTFGTVTLREVYPGIDWVLRSEGHGPVHQDFVVHPGADAARIRLRYRGGEALQLSADARSLSLQTALGEFHEGPLACSQGERSIPARFRLANDVLSVELGAHDRRLPVTIDPPLVWSTLYGGGSYDGPKSIYCDNRNGDVYVVGYSASLNMPCSTGVAPVPFNQGTLGSAPDAFIWKFDQLGRRQWATYCGGDSAEYAEDCTVDRLGNLYVTGHTGSNNFPVWQLAGAYWQPTKAGFLDAFVMRFNSQGIRQWATYYGGSEDDYGYAVTTDSTDQVYVVGRSASSDLDLEDPGNNAYFQPVRAGTSDSFILRFNTLGALTWATYHGGDSGDAALGVAVNASDLYMVGYTYSSVFPTVDPPGNADYFQGSTNGGQEAFISRFTLAGVQTWSTFYGGTGFDEARRVAILPSGELHVDGTSNSTDLPVFNPNPIATPNQPAYFQGTNNGFFDLFLLRFNTANVRRWATYLGGSNSEELGRGGRSLVHDSQGNLYLTGVSGSSNLPFTNPGGGAYFQNVTGNSDAILARFSPSDSLEWLTFFRSNNSSFGTAVGVGLGDCLFATGEFQLGAGFATVPVNPGYPGTWFQPTSAGDDDGYVARFCRKLSSCCLEATCTPVATAAECTALGGLSFHPGQSCAQVSCSVACTVCGQKFADVNRNGIRDNGEPALAGWLIELRQLNNAVYATTVTDANGNYCFTGIPCGNWFVTEGTQSGWVKIAPAGNGHSLSLPLATTQNGVDFGNFACATPPPCTPMPAGLAAWWPFDDGPGATQASDVTHAALGRNAALFTGSITSGDGVLCSSGGTSFASVPGAAEAGLDFGTGSFGVSTWIKPDAGSATGRGVAAKLGASTLGGFAGWALHLDGLQCMLELHAGSAPQFVPGPVLPAGTWSHVALSLDRVSGEGRWYLNGVPAGAPFVPLTGSLSNSAPLTFAAGLEGCLAQLALFHTPISPEVAAKAAIPDPGTGLPSPWCPDDALLPAARTICSSQQSVQVCFQLRNNSASPVTYSWSLAGLPAGPGCSNAGPTQFSPSAGTVTVPASSFSAPICVTITRPNGFTQQAATACYALTFVNHTTGVCRTRTAKLKVDNSCWCASTSPTNAAQVPAGGRVIPVSITRPCDPPLSVLAYRVVALPVGADPGTLPPVSLNGSAVGAPFHGSLSAGPGATAVLPVHVSFPNGPDPAAVVELVLEADTDGDGSYEPLTSTFASPEPSVDPVAGVPGGGPALARTPLLSSPNPFLGSTSLSFTLAEAGAVTLEVYDLNGRLVRSLVRGLLEPGVRRLSWDGRDSQGRRMAPGVYLARLRTRTGTQEARLVKVQ